MVNIGFPDWRYYNILIIKDNLFKQWRHTLQAQVLYPINTKYDIKQK